MPQDAGKTAAAMFNSVAMSPFWRAEHSFAFVGRA
jgi:hypothetical protein